MLSSYILTSRRRRLIFAGIVSYIVTLSTTKDFSCCGECCGICKRVTSIDRCVTSTTTWTRRCHSQA